MTKALPIAKRRIPLAVLLPVDTPDGAGGLLRNYQSVGLVWGSVTPLTGSERFVAQRAEQTITHRIDIRWRSDVAGGWRFQDQNRTFLIHGVFDPDQKRAILHCTCEEIAP